MRSSVAFLLLLCTSTFADSLWGPYAGFNVIDFGDFICANSDVRGRLAVKGNTRLNNYNVACQANDLVNAAGSDQCPSFGSWSCNTIGAPRGSLNYYGMIVDAAAANTYMYISNSQVSGGIAYGYDAGNPYTNVQTFGDCAISDWSYTYAPIDWNSAHAYFTQVQTSYASVAATGTVTNNGYGTIGFVGTGATDLEVFTLDGSVLSSANTISGMTNVVAKTVVINVNGAHVTFSGGSDPLRNFKSKVLWNLYEATSVTLSNYALWGSLIAPNAAFSSPAGVVWGQIVVGSFVSGTYNSPSTCAQINWIPFGGPSIPNSYCGNGIVEGNEQCDLGASNGGSSCCSSTCMFAPSTQVCRPSAGDCDVVEYCTGSSAQCPADQFKPSTTPCSNLFGICDLELSYHCPGDKAQCMNNAPTPLFTWDAFNVISFDSYNVNGGDVQGAVAFRNNGVLQGFDAGLLLGDSDAYTLFTVVTAGDLTWTSGQSHPTTGYPHFVGNRTDGSPIYKPEGYIGVGGTFDAPDYLKASQLVGAYLTGDQFDAAQAYYQAIQNDLAGLQTNAVSSVIYGDGLLITCTDATQDLYHVTVDGATLSTTNWYLTSGCKFTAGWIIDVTGSSDVTIKGGPFPGVVEKVVYNVLGSGRTIYGATGVSGNLLAPGNTYTQSTGVTYGRVIVGNIPEARQNNKPNCIDFSQVTVSNVNLEAVTLGDSWIYVVDVGCYSVGDMVCSPSNECKKVTGGVIIESQKRGIRVQKLMVSSSFSSSYPAGTLFTTAVDANSPRAASIPVTVETQTDATTSFDFSDATVLATSSLALLAALF